MNIILALFTYISIHSAVHALVCIVACVDDCIYGRLLWVDVCGIFACTYRVTVRSFHDSSKNSILSLCLYCDPHMQPSMHIACNHAPKRRLMRPYTQSSTHSNIMHTSMCTSEWMEVYVNKATQWQFQKPKFNCLVNWLHYYCWCCCGYWGRCQWWSVSFEWSRGGAEIFYF